MHRGVRDLRAGGKLSIDAILAADRKNTSGHGETTAWRTRSSQTLQASHAYIQADEPDRLTRKMADADYENNADIVTGACMSQCWMELCEQE